MQPYEAYEKKGYLVQDFRVFRLRDRRMARVPFHYHDFHKIILLLDGAGAYSIEGTSYRLAPRDVILVRAGEVHRPALAANAPYERVVVYIAPEFLARVSRPDAPLAACFSRAPGAAGVLRFAPRQARALFTAMARLLRAAREGGFAGALYLETLFVEFMILLHRALFSKTPDTERTAASDEKIRPLLGYIAGHLADDLSADALAARAYLSKYYFMRRFKAATGYSVHRYVTMKRLLCARALLTEARGRAVAEIGAACGFSDYTAFLRAFKAQFRCTPQAWRRARAPEG